MERNAYDLLSRSIAHAIFRKKMREEKALTPGIQEKKIRMSRDLVTDSGGALQISPPATPGNARPVHESGAQQGAQSFGREGRRKSKKRGEHDAAVWKKSVVDRY